MATVPSSTLQLLSQKFPLFSQPRQYKLNLPPYISFTTACATTDNEASSQTDVPESQPSTDTDSFESRLSQVRVRNRSGTGKKADVRKTRKGKKESSQGPGIYLPPVGLKEAVSDGLKVEFGFSPFSERINGRIAMLGLSALLLVELATGKSVINYHTPSIIFVQVYFIATISALYLKFEKEKISKWPASSPADN